MQTGECSASAGSDTASLHVAQSLGAGSACRPPEQQPDHSDVGRHQQSGFHQRAGSSVMHIVWPDAHQFSRYFSNEPWLASCALDPVGWSWHLHWFIPCPWFNWPRTDVVTASSQLLNLPSWMPSLAAYIAEGVLLYLLRPHVPSVSVKLMRHQYEG